MQAFWTCCQEIFGDWLYAAEEGSSLREEDGEERQGEIGESIFFLAGRENNGDRVRRKHSQVPSSWIPY